MTKLLDADDVLEGHELEIIKALIHLCEIRETIAILKINTTSSVSKSELDYIYSQLSMILRASTVTLLLQLDSHSEEVIKISNKKLQLYNTLVKPLVEISSNIENLNPNYRMKHKLSKVRDELFYYVENYENFFCNTLQKTFFKSEVLNIKSLLG